ncbi:hypothetical protein PIB30_020119 [Stylosanthes scabra]|uniref:Uncharacterized protein n=1 Tax=Stylosanthes scabra TaxID=79078 RepID=A0ABU6X9W0_9FABA|nr:hypothetical protein [Stylosanthes scabra]
MTITGLLKFLGTSTFIISSEKGSLGLVVVLSLGRAVAPNLLEPYSSADSTMLNPKSSDHRVNSSGCGYSEGCVVGVPLCVKTEILSPNRN